MDLEQMRREVQAIQWFHRIDLGNGITTPGVDNSPHKLAALRMPKRLDGIAVLDVGAWDGFFSFECERRGAAKVVAADTWEAITKWVGPHARMAGFLLAKRILNSRVEPLDVSVYDLGPESVGVFDVVLFLGVLYHLRHPLLALEKISSVTRRLCIVETHVDALDQRRPGMVFYPDAELNNDATNWWGPNPACVEHMLLAAGFSSVELVDSRYEKNRAVFHAYKGRA